MCRPPCNDFQTPIPKGFWRNRLTNYLPSIKIQSLGCGRRVTVLFDESKTLHLQAKGVCHESTRLPHGGRRLGPGGHWAADRQGRSAGHRRRGCRLGGWRRSAAGGRAGLRRLPRCPQRFAGEVRVADRPGQQALRLRDDAAGLLDRSLLCAAGPSGEGRRGRFRAPPHAAAGPLRLRLHHRHAPGVQAVRHHGDRGQLPRDRQSQTGPVLPVGPRRHLARVQGGPGVS